MNRPDNEKESAFDSFAENLVNVEKEDKKAKKEILKKGIERIEKDEFDNVKRSRVITSKLSSLREKADLSPFIGTSGKITSPRLRRGEFIEILAREILYIGTEEMQDTGGIVSLKHLREYFGKQRDNWELREKDIPEALEFLDNEDLIPELSKLSDENVLIFFKPVELTSDTRKILEAATGLAVTKKDLLSLLGWNEERLDRSLNQLTKDGIAIIDEENVYFPGI